MNIITVGSKLDLPRQALTNCISEYRGIKPQGKVFTSSQQDKSNTKKAYIVDSSCTECINGIIELLDNELDLCKCTSPHNCKHVFEVFDPRVFSGKITKNQTRIVIDPTKLAGTVSSVYTSVDCSRMEKTLKPAMKAYKLFQQARKTLLTVVHIDFPDYIEQDFMGPEKAVPRRIGVVAILRQGKSVMAPTTILCTK